MLANELLLDDVDGLMRELGITGSAKMEARVRYALLRERQRGREEGLEEAADICIARNLAHGRNGAWVLVGEARECHDTILKAKHRTLTSGEMAVEMVLAEGMPCSPEFLAEAIRSAERRGREEGLEEAAKAVREEAYDYDDLERLSAIIRSLKERQP